jgi:hypothetical protein
MNYQEQLNPWVIHQLLPDLTQAIVIRFRRRNEAESYLRVMQQMRPKAQFALTFETSLANQSIGPASAKNTVPAAQA